MVDLIGMLTVILVVLLLSLVSLLFGPCKYKPA